MNSEQAHYIAQVRGGASAVNTSTGPPKRVRRTSSPLEVMEGGRTIFTHPTDIKGFNPLP